jgi:hypothetical protein
MSPNTHTHQFNWDIENKIEPYKWLLLVCEPKKKAMMWSGRGSFLKYFYNEDHSLLPYMGISLERI